MTDQKSLTNESFKPEINLISAGFDAHKRDPLANLNLRSEDFLRLQRTL